MTIKTSDSHRKFEKATTESESPRHPTRRRRKVDARARGGVTARNHREKAADGRSFTSYNARVRSRGDPWSFRARSVPRPRTPTPGLGAASAGPLEWLRLFLERTYRVSGALLIL